MNERNIRDMLIKSKLPAPPKTHSERFLKGMFKCGKACTACPFINVRKEIKINNLSKWKINRKYSCAHYNIIYLIECNIDTCGQRYIGQSKRALKFRLAEHRGYISNKVLSQPTGAHFNLPGHSLANLNITILEQVKQNNEQYRKERESYFIRRFNTYYNGMNLQK